MDNMVKNGSERTHALAMLINILMGSTAFHRPDEFCELQDVQVLSGIKAAVENFSDSALGRTLDKCFGAWPNKALGAAAMRAALMEDVKFDVVYADTTVLVGERPV